MENFAKLFTAKSGGQLLVRRGESEEGNPQIQFIVMLEIGEMRVGVGFENEEYRDNGFDLLEDEKLQALADELGECESPSEIMRAISNRNN